MSAEHARRHPRLKLAAVLIWYSRIEQPYEAMSAIEKITVSLPAEMLADIEAAIEAGEFADVSEAVRDALRQWRRSRTVIALNDDELRQLVAEGRASGDPVEGERALRRLREKYATLSAEGN